MTITVAQRFTRTTPCPICAGFDGARRGHGERCFGFLSSDGTYAHCTREQLAGGLPIEGDANSYAHRLTGDCRCGQQHGAAPAPARSSAPPARQSVTAAYNYATLEGNPIEVLRYGPIKTFKQRRPDPSKPGAWIWHVKPKCDKVTCACQHQELPEFTPWLYHRDRLLEPLKRRQTIFIVEGERDVETLEALGLAATTNIGGAGKWLPRYSDVLVGARIVIVADKDAPGRAHAEQVAASVQPFAQSVRVIEVPA